MPTSAPGSSRATNPGRPPARGLAPPIRPEAGFTLVELLIVIAIIALSVGLIAMSLPDGESARLEEEGARLTALLEMARAESRVSGTTVRWVPGAPAPEPGAEGGAAFDFHFVGAAAALQMPTRWLDRRTTVEVVGAHALLLGPEAILPPQRVVLTLGERRLELASDGLGPFAPVQAPAGVQ